MDDTLSISGDSTATVSDDKRMDDSLSISSDSTATVSDETVDGLTSDLTLINEIKEMAENQFKKYIQITQPFATSDQLKNKFREISFKALDRFENESQSNNPKVFKNLKQSLTSDLDKIYQIIKTENERQRKQYLDNCPEKNDDSETLILSVYLNYKNIFGAIFDNNIENVFYTLSPNCIAFSDEVLVGMEAKEYLKTSDDFDVKKLFVSKVNEISAKDLNRYPFKYISVNGIPKAKFKNNCVTIESLIALQVLDIKSDAEKELSVKITNGVLVVPNHMAEHKNKFEKLSAMAGLASVVVISEISCAAIGYCHQKKLIDTNVLFFSINDMKCDAAIIKLNKQSIEYMKSCHTDLDDYAFDTDMTRIKPDIFNRIENLIIQNLDHLLPNTELHILNSNTAILLGFCDEMDFIVNLFRKHRPGIIVKTDKCGHLVSTGSAIYAKYKIEDNRDFKYDIKIGIKTYYASTTITWINFEYF